MKELLTKIAKATGTKLLGWNLLIAKLGWKGLTKTLPNIANRIKKYTAKFAVELAAPAIKKLVMPLWNKVKEAASE